MCSLRLTEIDDLLRPDHWFISPEDRVFFIREFISHGGFGASATNQLISNLKIPPTDTHRLLHKRRAIAQCAGELTSLFPVRSLAGCTFVPIPPSKAENDPAYDDRLVQVLRQMHPREADKDVRELVHQRLSTRPSHGSGVDRMRVQELIDVYTVDTQAVRTARENIVLFDDVLTAGAHYSAMKKVLQQVRPELNFVGLFIARVIRPQEDLPDPLI